MLIFHKIERWVGACSTGYQTEIHWWQQHEVSNPIQELDLAMQHMIKPTKHDPESWIGNGWGFDHFPPSLHIQALNLILQNTWYSLHKLESRGVNLDDAKFYMFVYSWCGRHLNVLKKAKQPIHDSSQLHSWRCCDTNRVVSLVVSTCPPVVAPPMPWSSQGEHAMVEITLPRHHLMTKCTCTSV